MIDETHQILKGYSVQRWMRAVKNRYPTVTFDLDVTDSIVNATIGSCIDVGMWIDEEECTIMNLPDPSEWSASEFAAFTKQIGTFSSHPNIYAYQYAGQCERYGGAHVFYIGVMVGHDSSYDIKRVHLTPNMDQATVTAVRTMRYIEDVNIFFEGLNEALT